VNPLGIGLLEFHFKNSEELIDETKHKIDKNLSEQKVKGGEEVSGVFFSLQG
jgi:hypothetical protein